MTDLGPDARTFLDAVRDAEDPSSADAARIRTGVALRLGAAAAAGTAATLGAKGASASPGLGGAGAVSTATAAASGSFATKLIVALVVAGSTVGVSAVALRPTALPASAPPPRATTAASAATGGPDGALARPKPADVPAAPPSAAPTASASAPALRPTPAVKTSAPAPDALVEEAALLRAANTALSSGDATTCLARLDDHAARFPRGALSEERGATRVHALCAAGRVAEARTAATAFVAAHPRSALAPAVRRSCTAE